MKDIITSAIRTDTLYRPHVRDDRDASAAHAHKIWLLVIVLLGLVVRLFRIDHQPLWLDEVITVERVHFNLNGLIVDSFMHRHMPTYFVLLRLLSQYFDASNAWLRIPSALFGAMSAGMVFACASRLGSCRAGIVAGLLMALSPLHVQYGQEARPYAMAMLLIAVALWGVLRLAQNPWRASIDVRRTDAERIGWGAYVLGTIAALDVLGDTMPWLIASNLSLLLIWRTLGQSSQARIAFRRNWLGSMAAIFACTAPFYVAIWAISNGQALSKVNWNPPLGWEHVWRMAGGVYFMRMLALVNFDLKHTAVPVLGIMVALAAGAGMFRMRGKLEGRILMLSVLVLPLAILSISLFRPLLLPRYLLWSAVPFFVFAGLGADLLPRRALATAITLLLLLGVVNLGPVYRAETKPRWDMAVATLAANVRRGDTVFAGDSSGAFMLQALKPKNGLPLQATVFVTSQPDEALMHWREGSRVWAVNGRTMQERSEELVDFKKRLAALGSPAVEIPQGKEITILMFPAPDEGEAN
jgi:4-amino-4-deoxy-L-arabinose transferase-like glycosyltransferase